MVSILIVHIVYGKMAEYSEKSYIILEYNESIRCIEAIMRLIVSREINSYFNLEREEIM